MPYNTLQGIAVLKLNISAREFWDLTFAEFWAIYELVFGTQTQNEFDYDEYKKLEREWLNGNT